MKAEYEARVSDYYYRNDRNNTVFLGCEPHLHYHVEFIYMEDGEAVAYVDSDEYKIKKGQFLAIFPNKIHRFENVGDIQKYHLFIISPDSVPNLSHSICNSSPDSPLIKDAYKNERLINLIHCLSDFENVSDTYREVILQGYITAFFGEVLSMLSLHGLRADDNRAMRDVVDFCSKNFTKDLSLSVLEDELHLSKYYISHLFGEKLGIRFNDYINSLRISEACRLLRTKDISITEISVESGFGTLRTFNRAFIKQIGISPSDYRKNNRPGIRTPSIPL